jgi:CRP-like cAMP-binding protein
LTSERRAATQVDRQRRRRPWFTHAAGARRHSQEQPPVVPVPQDESEEQALRAIRASRLLGRLAGDDLAALLDHGTVLRRDRGGLLLTWGDDRVLVLLSGAAKEHLATATDPDVVLRILQPGDVAGLSTALGTPSGGDVTALGTCHALVVPGRVLRQLARARPAVAGAWLRAATEQLDDLRTRIWAFASTSTSQRVVCRLLELSDRFGEQVDGECRVRCELTQAELASWAGASRESTAKALHELRRAGLVITRRRHLTILDPEALEGRHRDCLRHTTTGEDGQQDDRTVHGPDASALRR